MRGAGVVVRLDARADRGLVAPRHDGVDDAVTAADVQALAKKILRIQNRTTGLLKPVAAAPTADDKETAK